ncbi:hypothetical protein [Spirillospora sp. CA-294931]|uniref:hypothetical protein n=1 Tax=Spirillospora sp. CA-294931 TaxID=3240042 RepID=UPI003D8F23E8
MNDAIGFQRDQIIEALYEAVRDAPKRPMPEGPPGQTEVAIGLPELADAVMAVVQPELDRRAEAETRARRAEAEVGAAQKQSIAHVMRADAMRERAEQAERERDEALAAIAEVRRLQRLTIAASCRVNAIEQAQDTLAVLDRFAPDSPSTPRCLTEQQGEPVERRHRPRRPQGGAWMISPDLRDQVAAAIRGLVRISPGPNALADLNAGRSIPISGGEADDAALAAMPVINAAEQQWRERLNKVLHDADWGGPDRGDVIAEIRTALDLPEAM